MLYLSRVAFPSNAATVQQGRPSVLSLLADPLTYFQVQVFPEQHLLSLEPAPDKSRFNKNKAHVQKVFV